MDNSDLSSTISETTIVMKRERKQKTIVFALKYEPGMNFHELVCIGHKLTDRENKLLLTELRQRYADLVETCPDRDDVRIETHIVGVDKSTRFLPVVIPSGNARFKHVYLISSSPIHAPEATTKSEHLLGTEVCRLIRGILECDEQVLKFSQKSLGRFVADCPSRISELLLIGAVVAELYSLRSKHLSHFFVESILEEIGSKNFSLRNDRKPHTWLQSLWSKRS